MRGEEEASGTVAQWLHIRKLLQLRAVISQVASFNEKNKKGQRSHILKSERCPSYQRGCFLFINKRFLFVVCFELLSVLTASSSF